MSRTASKPVPGQDYVRISEVAKYLRWGRTKVYYWLERCPDIQVVLVGGFKMIPLDRLPQTLLRLKQAESEFLAEKKARAEARMKEE